MLKKANAGFFFVSNFLYTIFRLAPHLLIFSSQIAFMSICALFDGQFVLFVGAVYHVIIVAINWTWVVEKMLAYGNRLHSRLFIEFPYVRL